MLFGGAKLAWHQDQPSRKSNVASSKYSAAASRAGFGYQLRQLRHRRRSVVPSANAGIAHQSRIGPKLTAWQTLSSSVPSTSHAPASTTAVNSDSRSVREGPEWLKISSAAASQARTGTKAKTIAATRGMEGTGRGIRLPGRPCPQ